MFEKILKAIGLVCLFIFSFFYTEKVVTVVKSQDPIMIKINEYGDSYNIKAINASVEQDTMVPGLDGCTVDINRSYYNMKKEGYYSANMIEYKEIKPDLSSENIFNKYIIKGNKTKNEVALIFKVSNITYLDGIVAFLNSKNIKASFFMDGKLIESKSASIYRAVAQGHEIYNMGYDNQYDSNLLVWTNNLIETIAHNKSNYCLVLKDNKDVLNLCSKYKMHTIRSEIVINERRGFTNYMNVIDKGSIIVFDINANTIVELNNTIVSLNKKGYTYNVLSEHLSEKKCNTVS